VNLLLNSHKSTIKKEVLADEVQHSFISNASNTFIKPEHFLSVQRLN